ncbi:hypothetical protein ACFLZZ_01785 [Nanoarchaeota archaeon]
MDPRNNEKEEEISFFSEIKGIKEEINRLKEELNELRYDILVKKSMNPEELPQIPNNSIKTNLLPESSTGNEGVQTLRHIDTQTDNTPLFPLDGKPTIHQNPQPETSTHSSTHLRHIPEKLRHIDTFFDTSTDKSEQNTQISNLTKLMDTLKSDLKQKFESLTKQEFFIFSVLFTVDKTQNQVTYQDLAVRTSLTSSSIRDYIRRITQKGIPILKNRLNNKTTVLKIPPELRNLATLDNLMRIRGLSKDTDLNKFTRD